MCTCGCYDCGSCNPYLQEMVQCECCGKYVHRYEFCEQTGRCPDCEEASMVQCEVCEKWFHDDGTEDWVEENIVFCSEKCHIASTTPSPAGKPKWS